jgi:spermidine/putrescine transport system permease protein
VEQHLRSDLPGGVAPKRHRGRLGKRLSPYFLGAPAVFWLVVFFLVPLLTMMSLSLQTCDSFTLACRMTWHFGEFGELLGTTHAIFLRSLWYAGAATVIDLIVSFPFAYWIAFRVQRKSFFLLMLLVPFFVSFVIRTTAWQFLLSDQGIVFGTLKGWHLLPENFHVLQTGIAVVAGIAYNYLPFTALPLYVALERIDGRVLEAAHDLYANRRVAFTKVILPLAIPGVFAAFLLTFVPGAGDYVNAFILGGPSNVMIGNVIQTKFLVNSDYPAASSLSALLMVLMLVGIAVYAKVLGSRTIEEYI